MNNRKIAVLSAQDRVATAYKECIYQAGDCGGHSSTWTLGLATFSALVINDSERCGLGQNESAAQLQRSPEARRKRAFHGFHSRPEGSVLPGPQDPRKSCASAHAEGHNQWDGLCVAVTLELASLGVGFLKYS